MLLAALVACGSDQAAQDAPPADAVPADTLQVGDPCTIDFTRVITACSSTAWCEYDPGSPPYPNQVTHCWPSCDDHVACPSGYYRVEPIEGNHCVCYH